MTRLRAPGVSQKSEAPRAPPAPATPPTVQQRRDGVGTRGQRQWGHGRPPDSHEAFSAPGLQAPGLRVPARPCPSVGSVRRTLEARRTRAQVAPLCALMPRRRAGSGRGRAACNSRRPQQVAPDAKKCPAGRVRAGRPLQQPDPGRPGAAAPSPGSPRLPTGVHLPGWEPRDKSHAQISGVSWSFWGDLGRTRGDLGAREGSRPFSGVLGASVPTRGFPASHSPRDLEPEGPGGPAASAARGCGSHSPAAALSLSFRSRPGDSCAHTPAAQAQWFQGSLPFH